MYSSNANLVQDNSHQSKYNKKPFPNGTNKNDYKPKPKNFKKKKRNCFVCGQPGHHAPKCKKGVKDNNSPKPNANLVEGDEIIVAVLSQINLITDVKNWVIDSGATRHICADKDAFVSYSSVGNEEELVYLGDSRTAKVLGKGKILLKLTSGKTLALNNVLHVPNI